MRIDAQTPHATTLLAAYFSQLRLSDVPADVVAEAKRFVLDAAACTAAAVETEAGPLCHAVARMYGSMPDGASVAGTDQRFSLLAAGYANARLCNSMDFDECYPSAVHFGCGAFAAALAMAEVHQLAGDDFLLAVIAGYELGARVAETAQARMTVIDGRILATPEVWGIATCIVFAAVGAAAKALSMGRHQMARAFEVAASNAPVSIGSKWASATELPNTKYCDAGWCAVAGMFGALSAHEGNRSVDGLLEGKNGLFRMTGVEDPDFRALTDGLGDRWLLRDIMYKSWPCCRWIHYPLTALERILRDAKFDVDDIEEVLVETQRCAMAPRFLDTEPSTFVGKQFSHPHAIAMRLLEVPPGARWFSEITDIDPRVVALRRRVRVVEHQRMAPLFQQGALPLERIVKQMPAAVSVRTSGGIWRVETEHAWGDSWHESTRWGDGEMAAKVSALLPTHKAIPFLDKVMAIERQPNVHFMADLLRGAGH